MFRDFGGFWALFSDSLGFFTSIALGFVPKDPLGLDFKPKLNFIYPSEVSQYCFGFDHGEERLEGECCVVNPGE